LLNYKYRDNFAFIFYVAYVQKQHEIIRDVLGLTLIQKYRVWWKTVVPVLYYLFTVNSNESTSSTQLCMNVEGFDRQPVKFWVFRIQFLETENSTVTVLKAGFKWHLS
jgi:hypothetical protein